MQRQQLLQQSETVCNVHGTDYMHRSMGSFNLRLYIECDKFWCKHFIDGAHSIHTHTHVTTRHTYWRKRVKNNKHTWRTCELWTRFEMLRLPIAESANMAKDKTPNGINKIHDKTEVNEVWIVCTGHGIRCVCGGGRKTRPRLSDRCTSDCSRAQCEKIYFQLSKCSFIVVLSVLIRCFAYRIWIWFKLMIGLSHGRNDWCEENVNWWNVNSAVQHIGSRVPPLLIVATNPLSFSSIFYMLG